MSNPSLSWAMLPLLLCACSAAPRAGAEFLAAPDGPLRSMPFSEAVRAGDLLFVSGQLGTLPGSLELAPGGIAGEAEQALQNVETILQRHGAGMGDVVKCTVFLADIADWPAFNEVYRRHFRAPFPARSALAASGLALGGRVELECIAQLPR